MDHNNNIQQPLLSSSNNDKNSRQSISSYKRINIKKKEKKVINQKQ